MANDKEKIRNSLTLSADGEKIDRVFRLAVKDALRRHKHAGNPIAIWRDGKVVIVPPEQIKT